MTRTHRESWLVRILDEAGSTVGSGFLISGSTILTCAHVVTSAIATGHAGRPRDYVSVDLPAFQQQRQTEVVPGGWFPDSNPDLAVLALHGPAVRCDPPWLPDREPDVLSGFPAQWQVPAADWAEEVGYSGMPFLDGAEGKIIGMLTGGAAASAELGSHVLSASAIVKCWPPAADLAALAAGTAARHGGVGLAIREVGTVVEALLELPDLRDQRLRSMYIDLLAERTGAAADLDRYDDARRDLWSLATWCSRTFSGFTELLDVIREFHPASVEVDVLAERIERVAPTPLLTYGERSALEDLLHAIPYPAVVECSTRVMGPLPVFSDEAYRSVPNILRTLEDSLPLPGRAPRIVEFVALLAQSQDPGLRAGLLDWADTVTRRLGTPHPGMVTALEKAPAADRLPYYLTFQVREDHFHRRRYLLTVWGESRGEQKWVVHMQDEPLSLADVRAKVEELIERAESFMAQSGDVLVEFVLPTSLLDLPVEEWRAGPEAGAPPLGVSYPVVVRSLERVRTPSWRRRWEELSRHDASRDPVPVVVNAPAGDVTVPDGEWARELVRIADGAVPYLGSVDSPHLLMALDAGMPVVLWSRERQDGFDGSRWQDLIRQAPLSQLPRAIMRLRQEAVRSRKNDHVGRHLALLWDDPNRADDMSAFLVPPGSAVGETDE